MIQETCYEKAIYRLNVYTVEIREMDITSINKTMTESKQPKTQSRFKFSWASRWRKNLPFLSQVFDFTS